jgi:hypothetical protein
MSVPINEKFETFLSLLNSPKLLSALVSFKHSGYLVDTGWINSFSQGKPVDKDNKPVPWITLPAIEFLKSRVNSNLNVFEYGAGNSTLFFAGLVKTVISVEHNEDWVEKLKGLVPHNSKIIAHELNEEYSRLASKQDSKFDIILVDAELRVDCVLNSMDALNETGVIILDDTERPEYKPAFDFMKEKGFRELSFWGISPGYLYHKATTIFYRNENCFNI